MINKHDLEAWDYYTSKPDIRPMTDEERQRAKERKAANNQDLDEYGNYGENNPPV